MSEVQVAVNQIIEEPMENDLFKLEFLEDCCDLILIILCSFLISSLFNEFIFFKLLLFFFLNFFCQRQSLLL